MRTTSILGVLLLALLGCGGGPNGPHASGTLTATFSSGGGTDTLDFPTETTLYSDVSLAPEHELAGQCTIIPGTATSSAQVTVHIERRYPALSDPCDWGGFNRLDLTHDDTGTTLGIEHCPSDAYTGTVSCSVGVVTTSLGSASISLTHCTIPGSGGATVTVDGTLSLSHCARM